jgi:hypothetical protein
MTVAGCGLQERLSSAEERINNAVPLPLEAAALYRAVIDASAAIPGRRAELESAALIRLRQRALGCAAGFLPSWIDSAQTIRERLKDPSCFVGYDRDFEVWLRRVNLGTTLMLPPETAKHTDQTGSMLFQEEIAQVVLPPAGNVGVVTHARGWTVFDTARGTPLRRGASDRQFSTIPPVLSTNGRVLLTYPGHRQIQLEESISGRTLDDLGARGITSWRLISPTMAMLTNDAGLTMVVDHRTGLHATIPIKGRGYHAVLATTSADQFVFVGDDLMHIVRVESRADGIGVTILREMVLSGVNFNVLASAISSDGRQYLNALGQMHRLDLSTGELEPLERWPGHVVQATTHADPNKFIIRDLGGDRIASYVLDVQSRSVTRLEYAGDGTTWWMYWPAAQRYARVQGRSLHLGEPLPATGPTISLAEFNDQAVQAKNEKRLAIAAAQAEVQTPSAPKPELRPQIVLAPGARVLAVGAYESVKGQHGHGHRIAGPIDVFVARTAEPVALVLSSYEPVNWRIQLAPGARLGTVMLFGYHESSVVGQGQAQLYRGSQIYAYQVPSSEYGRLRAEVMRLTGRDLNGFQGRYSASNFTVGAGG